MPIKQVVVDASPLITLYKSQLANLLPQLFAQVHVPPAVWQEVTAAKDDISSQSLPQSNWAIRTEAIASSPSPERKHFTLLQRKAKELISHDC